jgi:hypothetical protein
MPLYSMCEGCIHIPYHLSNGVLIHAKNNISSGNARLFMSSGEAIRSEGRYRFKARFGADPSESKEIETQESKEEIDEFVKTALGLNGDKTESRTSDKCP